MIIKKNNQTRGVKNRNGEVSNKNTSIEPEKNKDLTEQTLVENIEDNINSANTTENQEQAAELFDIENIDFTQRQERRRGSRRRGYRRIDDRNLVSRAQEESENIKQSAYEEGYRIGLNKAAEDVARLQTELSHFMNAKRDVFEYIAPDILEISVDIAKKIIKKELALDPQIIINTIIDVLKTVSKSEPKIILRINPQTVQFVKDTIPDITYQYGIESKINIISDPSVDEGGCVLQTNNGIVDASVDTQLEIIKKAFSGMGNPSS